MKDLLDLLAEPPEVWRTWQKIPWHEPRFSERMLREHLDNSHDLASRSTDWVARGCRWLHSAVLRGRPSRVLDLGCGPGLYAHLLASLGHQVHGIDFSPASIRHATGQTYSEPRPTFDLADIRTAAYPPDQDLALMLFGELDVFSPPEGAAILTKAAAVAERLVAEVHRPDHLLRVSDTRTWSSAPTGLFHPGPHAVFHESHVWTDAEALAERWIVVTEAGTTVHKSCTRALSTGRWAEVLAQSGWQLIRECPALGPEPYLATLVCRRLPS